MARDMLRSARIRGYRCIEDVTFTPDPQRTTVIGGNGTGKTSLLDAIQFVADLVRFDDGCLSGDRRGSVGLERIEPRELSRPGGMIQVELQFAASGQEYTYALSLTPKREYFYVITAETLAVNGGEILIERSEAGSRVRAKDGMEPIGSRPASTTLHHCFDDVQYPRIAPAYAFMASIFTLRLVPALMRAPVKTADEPDRYGRDLAWRVHRMLTTAPDQVATFLEFMGDFVGWKTVRAPLVGGLPNPEFVEQTSNLAVALTQASDGTVIEAYLAAMAVQPPPNAALFLVDEPGTQFFSRQLQRPAELLRAMAANHQVVIATHALELIEEFADIDRTWVTSRKPGGGTVLRRFADFEGAGEAVADVGIADAVTTRAETMGEAGS